VGSGFGESVCPACRTRSGVPTPSGMADSRGAGPSPTGGILLASSGWGFLVCAAVAIGYGLWALYGSGSSVANFDAMDEATVRAHTLGPIHLDPTMNPLRAVLDATYAPVGSTRARYEVELLDAAGRRLWGRRGAFGNKDDDASVVMTTTSLGDFALSRPGAYFVRARMVNSGMDDLRRATLLLRRNVVPVDPRIPWGFGLAALLCLGVNLFASRLQPWPYRLEGQAPRTVP